MVRCGRHGNHEILLLLMFPTGWALMFRSYLNHLPLAPQTINTVLGFTATFARAKEPQVHKRPAFYPGIQIL